MNKIDLNKQVDFASKKFSETHKQRFISIALPFLALYPKTSPYAPVGITLYQCYSLWKESPSNIVEKLPNIALLVASTAVGYFSPRAHFIFSNGLCFVEHYKALTANDVSYDTVLDFSKQLLYVTSIYFNSPALIAISLLAQAINEFHQAYQEERTLERSAHILLATMRLLNVCALVSQMTHNHASKVEPTTLTPQEVTPQPNTESPHQPEAPPTDPIPQPALSSSAPQPPPKVMSQDDWNRFCSKYQLSLERTSKHFDLHKALISEGFSPVLENLNIQYAVVSWELRNLSFNQCIFTKNLSHSRIQQTTFNKCSIKTSLKSNVIEESTFIDCKFSLSRLTDNLWSNVTFTNCNLKKTTWKNNSLSNIKAFNTSFYKAYFRLCEFDISAFISCNFSSSSLECSKVQSTQFFQTDMTKMGWIESSIHNLSIAESNLLETNFVLSRVTGSQLTGCCLQDTLLLEAKSGFDIQGGTEHTITRPIVALGWNFEDPNNAGPYTKWISKALEENGALVLKFPRNSVFEDDQLHHELAQRLNSTIPSEQSIPQQLFDDRTHLYPEIGKIQRKASEILKHAHGLVLPGGEDIPHYFYQHERSPDSNNSMYRSLLEFALVHEANQGTIPTLGICRGAQLINVYFGGTLRNVDGQVGMQRLEWSGASSPHYAMFRKILPENFKGASHHHQGLAETGKGLEVILKRGDIPKLFISHNGNFIGSQFHPEVYLALVEDLADMGEVPEELWKQALDIDFSKVQNIVQAALEALREGIDNPDNIAAERVTLEWVSRFAENLLTNLFRQVQRVASNRNIYKLFMDKVESRRTPRNTPIS